MRSLEKPGAVLVDTAVWVEFFRGRGDIVRLVKKLVVSNQAVLCGVVISEVVQGIKSEKEREIVKEAFRGISYVEMDRACWEEAGDIALKLRKTGKVVPLTDILVATLAIHYGLQILSFDKHFELIPHVSLFKKQRLLQRE